MKKSVEVSEAEMKVLNAFREDNLRKEAEVKAKEAEVKAKEERKLKSVDLEKQFREAVKEVTKEINKHIVNSRVELNKAVELAEKHGVPFRSSMVDMDRSRAYVPRSFSSKWEDLDDEFLYDELDGDFSSYDSGWEYWSSSSLSC